MPRQKRPDGPGKHGRLPDDVAKERKELARRLVARARTRGGCTTLKSAYAWVAAQDEWYERWADLGPPGEDMVRKAWGALNPQAVDLCANLENEPVNRTAAEERRAAIVRWRETVNRWYGVELELLAQRTEAEDRGAEPKELRSIEERMAAAQVQRLAAERELAEATSVIDDESFDNPVLRSEVIAILARNRHHFTADESLRLLAIFDKVPEAVSEPDPDVPEYMQ